MNKKALLLLPLLPLLLMTGCGKKHFITDSTYRAQVEQDFAARRILAEGRAEQLFAGMDTLPLPEQEALQFLYAYMPYSDLADYDQPFFLQQIRAAFAARHDFAWGAQVPEEIFRHFVLVYRVNNENLDTARIYIQNCLKERLQGMSMYDAALEVNHWCHEHVAYRASDGRTSAPLATLRTGLGRCGEESTLTVTAMRAVGIPARQCYTPRWAHCDDNHAWVEVWVDGQWYFLGACEPDAELNMGWFAVPSTRAMMVHSFVFGPYQGREEVNSATALYSKINMLSNYAPTQRLRVTVTDSLGTPLPGATVRYKLYNYTEYYPLATLHADNQGTTTLTTGMGDLLIWATDGHRYAYAQVDTRQQDSLVLALTRTPGDSYIETYHMVPPAAGEAKVVPDPGKAAANALRLQQEDSMRADYRASFPNPDNWQSYLQPNANLTSAQAWSLLERSEGNYKQMAAFLNKHTIAQPGLLLNAYMNGFSDKDLRDVPASTMEQLLICYDSTYRHLPQEVFVKGLLAPRISNEMLRPQRGLLQAGLPAATTAAELQEWTRQHIAVDDTGNYYNCPISPLGVLQLRHSDAHSRDIFFVAACRDLHIPAYLDNATGLIYVWEQGAWHTVSFAEQEPPQPTAELTLTYKGRNPDKPTYWSHFSLAKYEQGDFVTFDFEEDPRMATFPARIRLEPGYYCLSTGSRYPEGDVLSRMEYFEVKEGQHLTKEIVLPTLTAKAAAKPVGYMDPTIEVVEDMATLQDYAGSKGMLMVFLGDYREPSKHLVKEMQEHRAQWAKWNGMTYLVAPESAKALSWNLPNTDCVLGDLHTPDPLQTALLKALKKNFRDEYPVVAVVNNKGEVLFYSEGYRIGLAEQILKVLEQQ